MLRAVRFKGLYATVLANAAMLNSVSKAHCGPGPVISHTVWSVCVCVCYRPQMWMLIMLDLYEQVMPNVK